METYIEVLKSFSLRDLLAVVALLSSLSILYTGVYRLFFHPLARFSGPLPAKLTSFYMIWHSFLGRGTYIRYHLHQQYGKVVRTGPNELSFADLASISDIYTRTTLACEKSPFYTCFNLTGSSSVFSTTDRATHARMRRVLSRGFSERGISRYQDKIINPVTAFLGIIQSSEQPIDLYPITHKLFEDIMSSISFDKSFNRLSGETCSGADDITLHFKTCPLFGAFSAAKYLPFGIFERAKKARSRTEEWVQSCIDDLKMRIRRDDISFSLLRCLVEALNKDGTPLLSNEEQIENAVIFIAAGSETSASTLLYLLYEVAKRPSIHRRLEEEIRNAFPLGRGLPDIETAIHLVGTPFMMAHHTQLLTDNSLILIVSSRKSSVSGDHSRSSRRESRPAR